MKNVILSTLVFSLFALSCNTNKRLKKRYNRDFLEKVPMLATPFDIDCGNVTFPLNENARKKLKPYTPAGYEVIGQLKSDYRFNVIVLASTEEKSYPTIYLTNYKGAPIRYVKLYEKTCVTKGSFESISKVSVMDSLKFTIVDKDHHKHNPMYNTGPKSLDTMITVTTNIQILKDGSIEKNIKKSTRRY